MIWTVISRKIIFIAAVSGTLSIPKNLIANQMTHFQIARCLCLRPSGYLQPSLLPMKMCIWYVTPSGNLFHKQCLKLCAKIILNRPQEVPQEQVSNSLFCCLYETKGHT